MTTDWSDCFCDRTLRGDIHGDWLDHLDTLLRDTLESHANVSRTIADIIQSISHKYEQDVIELVSSHTDMLVFWPLVRQVMHFWLMMADDNSDPSLHALLRMKTSTTFQKYVRHIFTVKPYFDTMAYTSIATYPNVDIPFVHEADQCVFEILLQSLSVVIDAVHAAYVSLGDTATYTRFRITRIETQLRESTRYLHRFSGREYVVRLGYLDTVEEVNRHVANLNVYYSGRELIERLEHVRRRLRVIRQTS